MAVVWFLIVIGILVLVHEFGHFIVAKRGGIKVIEFAFGFGPRLVKIQRGETLYSVRLLPLGGFCRFLSEHEIADDLAEGRITQEEYDRLLPRTFERKSFARRFGVLVAGAVFNFLLGAVLYVLLYTVWGVGEPTGSNAIVNLGPTYPASVAGLEDGDRIVSVNKKATPDWEAVLAGLAEAQEVRLQVQKPDGSLLDYKVSPKYDLERHVSEVGINAGESGNNTVAGVTAESSAAQAGITAGDLIVAVNGTPTSDWAAVTEAITKALVGEQAVKEVNLEIQKVDGSLRSFAVAPMYDTTLKKSMLGITNEIVMKKVSPLQALRFGAMKTVDFTQQLLSWLWGLITGNQSVDQVGGAITLVQQIDYGAEKGVSYLWGLMAALSIQFGVINLLPLPALDGGQLVVISYEKIRGKELKMEVKWYIQMTGLVLLTGLMVLLLFKDIVGLFQG